MATFIMRKKTYQAPKKLEGGSLSSYIIRRQIGPNADGMIVALYYTNIK